jgi:hypothetical protein
VTDAAPAEGTIEIDQALGGVSLAVAHPLPGGAPDDPVFQGDPFYRSFAEKVCSHVSYF